MSPLVALLLVVVLIAANGFFVAAEFALVATRTGGIEARAAAGDRRAIAVVRQLDNLSFVLSAAQFGITATSLVVGFLAEQAVGGVLILPLLELLGLPAGAYRPVALTAAFLLATFVQMLFGELAPKNLAIARAEGTSLAVARLMRAFGVVFGPVIRVFDSSAEWVSRVVFRLEVQEERLGVHSQEDLARIIAASREEGSLTETQGELLERAVELGDRRVHEVMVPRPDVVFLRADDTLEDLRVAARDTGHSRFPVRGDTEDDVLGTVHIKDLLGVPAPERTHVHLRSIASEALVVPESERLRRLLRHLRSQRRTFAVVVDEYGGTAGIVTVEDVLEELVGEIEDEFDRERGHVRRIGAGRFLVSGSLRVDHVERTVGVALPEGEYETVAGFVIDRLGHIPAAGESTVWQGWSFEVVRVSGARVAELRVERLSEAEPAEGAT